MPNDDVLLDILGSLLQIVRIFNHNVEQDFYKVLYSAGFTDHFIQLSITEIPQIHFTPKIFQINKLMDLKWRLDISFCDRFVVAY